MLSLAVSIDVSCCQLLLVDIKKSIFLQNTSFRIPKVVYNKYTVQKMFGTKLLFYQCAPFYPKGYRRVCLWHGAHVSFHGTLII